MVYRVFVEKKRELANEAKALLADVNGLLGITSLTDVRIINRYDAENISEELKDTSVVMTKFDIGDGLQGMIGVVGPTRMDYAKVTARLSYFAESLSKMFSKPEQAQLPAPEAENE